MTALQDQLRLVQEDLSSVGKVELNVGKVQVLVLVLALVVALLDELCVCMGGGGRGRGGES